MSAQTDTTQQSLPVRIAEQKMTIIFAVRRLTATALMLFMIAGGCVVGILGIMLGVANDPKPNLFFWGILGGVLFAGAYGICIYGRYITNLAINQSDLLNELHDSDSK
jgi:uncharacterized membrane protein YdfJ with MMPL/SSD domain